jgi:uncharacterized protein (DUF885 family)
MKFLQRLQAFPRQVNEFIQLLEYGIQQNRVASKDMLRKTCQQILDVAENPTKIIELINESQQLNAEEHARAHATYVPQFKQACCHLEKFLREQYVQHARPIGGCTGMPDGIGTEVYKLSLKFHTTTNMSPEEVHTVGLSEVQRIRDRYKHDILVPLHYLTKEKADTCSEMDFAATFAQFVQECRTNPTFYYNTEEELLEGYRTMCDTIRTILPNYFNTFPSSPLEIVAKNAETAPAAYYLAGTPDGSRPGRFYVNVSNISQRPKYEMTSLALHEGIPGHHHQCALALENEQVPNFLRFLEDRRYEFCPARRQLYAAYLEGWALYCESLGEEMGMYQTPMELFGKLSMEMMRAVRLVVDTGIHKKGWSVETAIKYMMEQTGMHRHEVEAECYRYEAWPGQACGYKIGEIAIWRMRKYAEKQLGDELFVLKDFHDVLLNSGPMPLNVLEAMVHKWVEDIQLAKTMKRTREAGHEESDQKKKHKR